MSHISLRDIKLRSNYCAIKWHEWHDLYKQKLIEYNKVEGYCDVNFMKNMKQKRREWCDCCDKYGELVSKYCKENPGPNMNVK